MDIVDITYELEQMDEWLGQEGLDPAVRVELEELRERYRAGGSLEAGRGEGAAESRAEEACSEGRGDGADAIAGRADEGGVVGEDAGADAVAEEINDRFYRFMEFGTAGMRGVMGAGSNRINIHTIRKITQGYADYLNEITAGLGRPSRVAIAYDNRRHSDLFALEAALVFVANGVEAHLFERLSATPLLSYAARELGADGGVVVTASHNNKDYNGYKIYDSHGCQCMPDDAERVADLIDGVDMWRGVKTVSEKYTAEDGDETVSPGATPGVLGRIRRSAAAEPLLKIIPEDMENAYIDRVLAESRTPGALADLRAVYTPLNGAGCFPVQKVLRKAGIAELFVVKEQEYPDPDFTTAPEPNPEKPEALALGLALCEKLKNEGRAPDILIATDPDADRLGAAIKHEGSYVRLTGNQVGVLILDYLITCREAAGDMPDRPVFITTIVSTSITGEMAKKHGIEIRKVLTGFKNIGDQMNRLEADGEEGRYIFGFEESCGYCSGVYCRDKDAQNAALLLLEAAGVQKKKGRSLLDRVEELYREYGYFLDGLDEFVRPGEKGMHEIAAIMAEMRRHETVKAFSPEVLVYTDYQTSERTEFLPTGDAPAARHVPDLPVSDVVQFDLADGCRIIARPSGTEPKLKIYYVGVGPTETAAEEAISRMRQEIAGMVKG